ncbi:MAG: ribosome recycling factor [Candidatus Gracilibacteria bacterium]|nr:ribosome recycling factor [Candidatus Gracilibacteria bacterium]
MLGKAKEGIEKTLKHLEHEYAKLQLGRANPVMVEGIMVEQYGSLQKIQNMAAVSNMDSQTLMIKPWDRSVIHAIAKAITESGLGLNPQTMADSIIIKVPPLTEERRKEVAKVAKKMSEDAKVGIRNARSESLKAIKNAEDKKEISEDMRKDMENDLQKLIDEANKKVEDHLKHKEADIMKI